MEVCPKLGGLSGNMNLSHRQLFPEPGVDSGVSKGWHTGSLICSLTLHHYIQLVTLTSCDLKISKNSDSEKIKSGGVCRNRRFELLAFRTEILSLKLLNIKLNKIHPTASSLKNRSYLEKIRRSRVPRAQ